jgi:hypothetical protein
MQVFSVAQLVLPAETVGLTGPQGLFPLDQSPIPSMSFLIICLTWGMIASLTSSCALTRGLLHKQRASKAMMKTLLPDTYIFSRAQPMPCASAAK